MALLSFKLFGYPQLFLDDKPILQDNKRALAILIYLAVNNTHIPRDELVELIWDIAPSGTDIQKGRSRLTDQLRIAKDELSSSTFDAVVHETSPDRLLWFVRDNVGFDTDAIDDIQFVSLIRPTFSQLEYAIDTYAKEPFLHRFRVDGIGYNSWKLGQAAAYEAAIFRIYRSLIIAYLKQPDRLSTVRWVLNQWQQLKPTLVQPQAIAEIAEFDLIFQALTNGFEAAMETYFNAVSDLDRLETDTTERLDILRDLVRDNRSDLRATLFTKLYPDVVSPVVQPVNLAKPPPPYYVELGDVEADLRAGLNNIDNNRIVCLVGMHGVGKTTVAEYFIKTQGNMFEAIFSADLSVDDAHATIARWLQAMGQTPDPNNFQSSGVVLRHVIGERRVLIFLDDVQSTDQIELFMPTGRRTSVLVTTNQRSVATHLEFEYGASIVEFGLFDPVKSNQLMRKILSTSPTYADNKYIRRITRALNHLPLGIVLIAKRIRSIPSHSALEQVAATLATLESQPTGLHEIRPIASALRIGWEFSDQPDLYEVFSALGVFGARNFTDDVVTYLIDRDINIDSILSELVNLSLLNVDYHSGRYDMHVLISQFAREQLGDRLTELERRMSDYYADIVKDIFEVEQLVPDVDNILVAIDIAYQHEEWENVMVLADSLEEFWVIRGRFDEAIETFQKALTAALALKDTYKEAFYYLQLGNMHLQKNELVLAEENLTQCYAMVDLLDDEGLLGDVLIYLGRLEIEKANYEEAKEYLEAAIAINKDQGDLNGIAYAKFLLSHYYLYKGGADREIARQLATEALEQQVRDDDVVGQIRSLHMLGSVAYNQKRYEDSRDYAETAIDLCESIHEFNELTVILDTLCLASMKLDDCRQALVANNKAIKMLKVIADIKNLARAYISRSQILLTSDKLNPAQRYIKLSLEIYERLEYRSINGEVRCHNIIGDIYAKRNDIPNAHQSWQHAIQLVRDHSQELNVSFWIPYLENKLIGDQESISR